MRTRTTRAVTIVAVVALLAVGCGSDEDGGGDTGSADPTSDSTASDSTAAGAHETLRVPEDHDTIQAAVDAAQPGDLVLIGPGVYEESVVVQTDDIVLRGTDRNEVIVDGEFERENGITVFSNGVAVENLTSRNHTANGVFFTGDYDADFTLSGWRASYVTVYNNGDYGIYAFNATKGQIDHSYGSGHPDSAFYIGQCDPCDAVITDVLAENNQLGYSGTNSSDVTIVNSEWRYNRFGIAPNSQDSEELAPGERTTIVGNLVYENMNANTPGTSELYLLAFGVGILLAGVNENVVERNTVVNNEKSNIAVILWPSDTIYLPHDNTVRDNITEGAVTFGDLGLGLFDTAEGPLGNCFADNEFTTSSPEDVEAVAPCDGEGQTGFQSLDLAQIPPGPPPIDYQIMAEPTLDFENMPDADTAPPRPATDVPIAVDLDAIEAPPRPE